MEHMELQMFCKHVQMWEDDPAAMLAFVDYIDEAGDTGILLTDWWSIYKEDYV